MKSFSSRISKYLLELIFLIVTIALSSVYVLRAAQETYVQNIINEMTLCDKITQMMMPCFKYWDIAHNGNTEEQPVTSVNNEIKQLLNTYHFGGVILFKMNLQEIGDSIQFIKDLQSNTIDSGGLPLIISTDQEGGMVNRLNFGTYLPGNMALAATQNTEYAKDYSHVIASELGSIGINTDLAPVADINTNPNNPVIGVRSFGDKPGLVSEFAVAIANGLKHNGIISCAKHFPGHGDTDTDSHTGLPIINKSLDEINSCELIPFKELVKSNVPMIMSAHILYPQIESNKKYSSKTGCEESLPVTMSQEFLSQILKKEMGFKGIVCTDAMDMEGITNFWTEEEAFINAIEAGADLVCMPTKLQSSNDTLKLERIINAVENKVKSGEISEKYRIDRAVARIIKAKKKFKILDYDKTSYDLLKAEQIIRSNENLNIESKISEASVTVVKNDMDTIPLKLKSGDKLTVFVPYENEIAQYYLAWNRAVSAQLIPSGTNLEVLKFDNNANGCYNSIDDSDFVIIASEIWDKCQIADEDFEYRTAMDLFRYAKTKSIKTIVISTYIPYDVVLYNDADALLLTYGCIGSDMNPNLVKSNSLISPEPATGPNLIAGMITILGINKSGGKLPVNLCGYEHKSQQFGDRIIFKYGFGL